jgi:hypothetical protein
MVHLGDEAQLETRFGPFRDSANFDARSVHGFHRMYRRLKNRFGRTRWNSYVTWVLWNLILIRLEMVQVSVQDRCTVEAKRTIGSKIVLDTPDGTPRRRGSTRSSFRSV